MSEYLQWKCAKCDGPTLTIPISEKWISVKERLPAPWEIILLGWDGRQFFPYDKIDRRDMTSIGKGSVITHWMKLPDPPVS